MKNLSLLLRRTHKRGASAESKGTPATRSLEEPSPFPHLGRSLYKLPRHGQEAAAALPGAPAGNGAGGCREGAKLLTVQVLSAHLTTSKGGRRKQV